MTQTIRDHLRQRTVLKRLLWIVGLTFWALGFWGGLHVLGRRAWPYTALLIAYVLMTGALAVDQRKDPGFWTDLAKNIVVWAVIVLVLLVAFNYWMPTGSGVAPQ